MKTTETKKAELAQMAKFFLDDINREYDTEPQLLSDMGFEEVLDALQDIVDSYYSK